ncbi:MAG: hypothetical protein WDN28_21925 [Chthoniobacter sp.]
MAGAISIRAFTADLAAGSTIDVSGGVSINATGQRSYGAGGGLIISAGNEPGFAQLFGGGLTLGSTLAGYSGGKGGALTIQAPLIQVGGALPSGHFKRYLSRLIASDRTEVRRDELLYLTPDFFHARWLRQLHAERPRQGGEHRTESVSARHRDRAQHGHTAGGRKLVGRAGSRRGIGQVAAFPQAAGIARAGQSYLCHWRDAGSLCRADAETFCAEISSWGPGR